MSIGGKERMEHILYAICTNGIVIISSYSRNNSELTINQLFNSVCGYSTLSRQEKSRQHETSQSTQKQHDWRRHAAYDFTGCLAHADVTYLDRSENRITIRILGCFDHNKDCQMSRLVRYPPIPIHEHVVEVALRQLRLGLG